MRTFTTSALCLLFLSVTTLAQPKTEGAGRDTGPLGDDFPLMPLIVGLIIGLVIGYFIGARAEKRS